MKQVAIKITLLILLFSLTLALIACHDETVDEGTQSTDVTSTDVPSSDGESNEDKPNEGGSKPDGTVNLPYVPF